MSAALRFLAVAVVGWIGVRAVAVGTIPGAEMFSVPPTEAATVPPIVPTEFPPIDPPVMAAAMPPGYPTPYYGQYAPAVVRVPVYFPVPQYSAPSPQPLAPQPAASDLTPLPPADEPLFYSQIAPLDEWPVGELAERGPLGGRSPTPGFGGEPVLPQRLDRLQLSSWALLRSKPGPDTLASGGTLGGSQAGARLLYNVTPWLAASVRSSAPVDRSTGGEVAAGVRVRPLQRLPIYVTAERRQGLGKHGGRSAFALLGEGGLYQRPMPYGFALDGYAQAGVVGIRSRDLFADGGFTLTRPLFARSSAGLGVWGGVQPGLYRVDVGPRVSMPLGNRMRVHVDWRQRVAGSAAPGSGPALTLAADF